MLVIHFRLISLALWDLVPGCGEGAHILHLCGGLSVVGLPVGFWASGLRGLASSSVGERVPVARWHPSISETT